MDIAYMNNFNNTGKAKYVNVEYDDNRFRQKGR